MGIPLITVDQQILNLASDIAVSPRIFAED